MPRCSLWPAASAPEKVWLYRSALDSGREHVWAWPSTSTVFALGFRLTSENRLNFGVLRTLDPFMVLFGGSVSAIVKAESGPYETKESTDSIQGRAVGPSGDSGAGETGHFTGPPQESHEVLGLQCRNGKHRRF